MRMAKILILTPQLPYPPEQGTSLRNFHIIRGLADGHDVTLLSYREDNQRDDPAFLAPLTGICDLLEPVPVPVRSTRRRLLQLLTSRKPDMAHRLNSDAFNKSLRTVLSSREFDIVQIEGLELAESMHLVRELSPDSKIVFDDHNAEAELQRRTLLTDAANPKRWLAAAYSWVQVARLRRFERWACQTASWVVAVSESDRKSLEKLVVGSDRPEELDSQAFMDNSTSIPNCIDVGQVQSQTLERQPFDIVFSGKMDYRPNIDAVLWFANEVWPLIRARKPEATWAIVGQKPHQRIGHLQGSEGITLTGWVETVGPYINGAGVYVMPFRIGSGTRLKLLEAMAIGKAVVSTRIGAEGYPVRHGRELLLADAPEELANSILSLLEDREWAELLGRRGKEFAADYDWRKVVPRFNSIYQQLLG